jgi:uncharacterized Zn finger protein
MSSLAQLLSEPNLRRLAGARSYERGLDYAAAGQVARLTRGEERVEASVQGTHRYRVVLWVKDDGELTGSCSCPMGAGGAFCKHCVATGLAAFEAGEDALAPVGLDEVRDHLAALKKRELIDLLVAEAREDERLLDRLRLRMAAGRDGVDMGAFRDAIDRAVDPGGFVTYAEAYDYSRTLDETIGMLRVLLDQGHPTEAVELVEHCAAAIERAVGMVDDSDGHLGSAFDDLQRLHLEACERVDFERIGLAERLFALMMATDYDLFYNAAEDYAHLLGETGRRRYAELVRAEWKRLPVLRPADDRRVEEMVAVLSRDLSLPYSFLRIAEVYAGAGRYGDALEWAERGLEAFPDRPDSRLVTFLAEAYRERGEHERAAELIWGLFADRPDLGSYQDLKPYAERAGQWDETRERALALIGDGLTGGPQGLGAPAWLAHRGATGLVRIHLRLLLRKDPGHRRRGADDHRLRLRVGQQVRRRREHLARRRTQAVGRLGGLGGDRDHADVVDASPFSRAGV